MSTQTPASLLSRRVEKILPGTSQLKTLLDSGKKIRLYQGFDPTGARLHLGHTIGLRKLMEFARAGHEVIFLFGTGTVLVGDPSERASGRKLITQAEIDRNIQDWQQQVSPIVDFNLVTIRQNGDWLTQMALKDIIQVASHISAVQLFKRESFTRRLKQGDTVWYHETMYPLLQGYDSVVMDVDLEIGGTDQEFNMLIGRELQRKMNQREKFVLTVPMILGTDGRQMSKSSGNCIWLDDSAQDIYGKVMSLPDNQVKSYWELLTDLPTQELEAESANPLAQKKRLAFDIARQLRGETDAQAAQDHFERTVQKGAVPDSIPTATLHVSDSVTISDHTSVETAAPTALDLCRLVGVGETSSQIKRIIKQGGVELDNQKLTDPNQAVSFQDGSILKFGKRRYYRIRLQTPQ